MSPNYLTLKNTNTQLILFKQTQHYLSSTSFFIVLMYTQRSNLVNTFIGRNRNKRQKRHAPAKITHNWIMFYIGFCWLMWEFKRKHLCLYAGVLFVIALRLFVKIYSVAWYCICELYLKFQSSTPTAFTLPQQAFLNKTVQRTLSTYWIKIQENIAIYHNK